jgi:hypothetical protein
VPSPTRLAAQARPLKIQVPDWNAIAEQCGTTSGAASKRYFRMKQAFEANAAPPDSNPSSPAPKTPSKKTKTTTDGEATPTPKRKRATPKKQVVNEEYDDDDEIIEPKQDTDDDDDAMTMPKKMRTTKPKGTPKPENFGTSLSKEDVATVKNEVEDDAEEPFVDAAEWVNELVDGEITSNDERASCKFISISCYAQRGWSSHC